MAALNSDPAPPRNANLAQVMREFKELVRSFEAGLLRSLADHGHASPHTHGADHVRRQACRLAITDLSNRYTPKYIRRSLNAAESAGKRLEEQLTSLSLHGSPPHNDNNNHDHGDDDDDDQDGDNDSNSNNSNIDNSNSNNNNNNNNEDDDDDDDTSANLAGLHNGHFRLYSTELFDLLGQPAELRFGTLRFHKHHAYIPNTTHATSPHQYPVAHSPWINVELALNNSFYIADSIETLPYHTFRLPSAPSLQNRGILSRKPQDHGAFPAYDSWLLFTFLGSGCIKLEVPIEMCADVYGGPLTGRENHEVLFWGFFVDDQDDDDIRVA
ncbi:hypothetical protein J1614_012161 [Plenodomus biglobosus]|nr:hypothetical protein J1614_012161 [Plenodomus biglobosus]